MNSDPSPCRPQDLGKFEITRRDGAARLGKLFTKHGILNTPALLPVVNPNILTVEPRSLWDEFGFRALITNSYVIWKNDNLRERATEEGIHELLDFPGVIMTDSGTFQSYVYGDVEVSVEEIVKFQATIGVDIGTMLDVFGRPDMTRKEIEDAVRITVERAPKSLQVADSKIMLNGPIQGGLHQDLRAQSAKMMAESEFQGNKFSIHPIGGIVPLMESQRYHDLIEIILSSSSELPANRPMHIFGCGHPMLFPMCIALGADLFDSAAYALFAKDGRLLSEEGTYRIESMVEWPTQSSHISTYTPAQVRAMRKPERTSLLARHNLEVTQRELARCREAVRNGSIWSMAERRSHSSPHLREAFLGIIKERIDPNQPSAMRVRSIIKSTDPVRPSSEPLSEDLPNRPHIIHAKSLLVQRWRPPGSWHDGSSGPPSRVVVMKEGEPPWRASYGSTVQRVLKEDPRTVVMIDSPIGLVPYSLEDLSPWCRVEGSNIHRIHTKDIDYSIDLKSMGLGGIPVLTLTPEDPEYEQDKPILEWIERCSFVDKLSVLCGVSPAIGCEITDGIRVRRSNTNRPVNVFNGEMHLFSPRLNDGGISLALHGAKFIHEAMKSAEGTDEVPKDIQPRSDHRGLPRITIHRDAIPFVGAGRNVMHGFILNADPWLIVGQPCLVVDEDDNLVAHGVSNSTSEEMAVMTKGVAVKVREGALDKNNLNLTAIDS
ncbi:MAG: tRNA guanosine(15) transglycosylase TgtA [Candidatus Thermoplasmatota archaeon]|nr:tRNA guanosine(15) transglycosylase TgtA [Candidatus Thermoplasmatota archaeon]MEC9137719.1 tRNA guanosine(15) transglycosylase TgtA [Candidatus Thermoplasmatota archaeon]